MSPPGTDGGHIEHVVEQVCDHWREHLHWGGVGGWPVDVGVTWIPLITFTHTDTTLASLRSSGSSLRTDEEHIEVMVNHGWGH